MVLVVQLALSVTTTLIFNALMEFVLVIQQNIITEHRVVINLKYFNSTLNIK